MWGLEFRTRVRGDMVLMAVPMEAMEADGLADLTIDNAIRVIQSLLNRAFIYVLTSLKDVIS